MKGSIPPESWNRFGTRVLTKMRAGTDLEINVEFSATFDAASAQGTLSELTPALQEMGVEKRVVAKRVDEERRDE